jgi:glycosyltransferase involved in cell wall biosynthesis
LGDLLPKISVIIPAYNCAAFLPETLESVFAQTCGDIEIILVDDGSTDNTRTVIAPHLDRITYIRQENKGLSAARNTGIRAAKGDFIALLDADDSWAAEKLDKQLPRFADTEVGIVYSDFSVRYSDGRFQSSYLVNRPLASEGNILENYIQSRFLFPSTMVIRRRCFEEFGGFDEEMLACEDIELFARICSRWKAAMVKEPLVTRYEGTHNLTANSRRMNQYTILALKKVLLKEPALPRSTRKVIYKELGQQHWWYGYGAYKEGNMGLARQSLMASIRCDPHNLRAAAFVIAASFLPAPTLKLLRQARSRI